MGYRLRWRSRFHPKDGLQATIDAADAVDVADFLGGILVPVVVGIAVIVVLVVVLLLGLPVLLLALEALILVVLVAWNIVARAVLRRPWTIVAEEVATSRTDRQLRVWRVVGWRASGRAVDDIARHLEAGVEPAPNVS